MKQGLWITINKAQNGFVIRTGWIDDNGQPIEQTHVAADRELAMGILYEQMGESSE